MRQHYLSIHSLKKILKKLLFFKAGLAQFVWVAKWQVPSADHTPPSFQFLFPDRICQLFWDFLFSLTYQILIPVLSPRHSKKTDETVEHVIFLMQNFQCLDFFVDAVVPDLNWSYCFSGSNISSVTCPRIIPALPSPYQSAFLYYFISLFRCGCFNSKTSN